MADLLAIGAHADMALRGQAREARLRVTGRARAAFVDIAIAVVVDAIAAQLAMVAAAAPSVDWRHLLARIAGISGAVVIGVELVGVRDIGAVVAVVGDAVTVAIERSGRGVGKLPDPPLIAAREHDTT